MTCSVAMCTYNGEKYITDQLRSIINQSTQPDELIICDDNSSDKTVERIKCILGSWDKPWHIYINKQNLGYRKNFQKAISLCKGDIIFLSDQDDVWQKDKITIMMKAFQDNPHVLLAFHDAEITDAQLNCIGGGVSFWKVLQFNPEIFVRGDYSRLFQSNVVQGAACGFRKELFDLSSLFPDEAVHDEWLALNAALLGGILPIKMCLLKYRQTGSNEIGASKESFIMKAKKWSFSLKNKITAHRNTIQRRKSIWYALFLNNKSKYKVDNHDLEQHYMFLSNRLQCISNSNFLALPVRKYRVIYKSEYYSLKQYIKDVLACIFK